MMMQVNPLLAGLVTGLVVVALLALLRRMWGIERDLSNARDELRDVRKMYWDLYIDAHAAFTAMGLTKTPAQDPQWVKAGADSNN
jgi:hypothetical protein